MAPVAKPPELVISATVDGVGGMVAGMTKELHETLIRIAGAWPAENAELARKDPIKFLSIFLGVVEREVVEEGMTGTYIGSILDECSPYIIAQREDMAERKKKSAA